MTEVIPRGRRRISSDGDVLEEDTNNNLNLSLNELHRKFSKSCQSMSTSEIPEVDKVVDFDENNTKTLPLKSKKNKGPAFKSVKNLMHRFGGPKPTKQTKQTHQDGLVKGGLTPTLKRRDGDEGRVVSPDNYEKNAGNVNGREFTQHEVSITTSSTSRPLMTKSALQCLLPKWDVTPGTIGLHNHGNTCFLNSVLQCLSNTDLFAEYFVNKHYKDLLNQRTISKVFGNYKAEVSEQLSVLLESIWTGEYQPELSSHFKAVVSKFNCQYKGSSQHDAQEFLLWLLDRLNDELHQSKKKSKETKSKKVDSSLESSPDAVLASSSGCQIYNHFQAVYQSSLICPDCSKQSNTYETYLCLSLPVPQKCMRPVYVTIVFLDEAPLKIGVELNVLDTVRELREKLSLELEIRPSRIVLCQIYDDGFRNTYGDDQPLSDIHESETVYAFEMFPPTEVKETASSYEQLQLLLVHVEKATSPSRCYPFCNPVVVKLPRDISYQILQREILRSMRHAVPEEILAHADKLDVLFKLRVVDAGMGNSFLPTDVEMPLYTQAVESALSTYSKDYGTQHVKLVVEWDTRTKSRVVEHDDNPVDEHQSVHRVRLAQQQPTHVSLDECFKLFTKEEKLSGDDAWHCPTCGEQQSELAYKKLGLWSLPDILVVHLKRFRQAGLRRNKLNTLVNFPVSHSLDMSRFLLPRTGNESEVGREETLYELDAVANHYGNMSGGHYTAFCKNPVDRRWYEFDDTHVKPLDTNEVASRAAYLLFYQRKTLTSDTLDRLVDGTHWIYDMYGPPPRPPGMENGIPDTVNEPVKKSESDRVSNSVNCGSSSVPHSRQSDNVPHKGQIPRNQKTEASQKTADGGKSAGNHPASRNERTEIQTKRTDIQSDRKEDKSSLSGDRSSDYVNPPKLVVDLSPSKRSVQTNENQRDIKTDGNKTPPYKIPVLNNERSVSSQNGVTPGLEKLKIQANEIRTEKVLSSSAKKDNIKSNRSNFHEKTSFPSGPSEGRPPTTKRAISYEQANSGPSSLNLDLVRMSPTKESDWSTPQQPRKSSPGSPSAAMPWLTPQPARKQEHTNGARGQRPPMNRQLSAPNSRNSVRQNGKPPVPQPSGQTPQRATSTSRSGVQNTYRSVRQSSSQTKPVHHGHSKIEVEQHHLQNGYLDEASTHRDYDVPDFALPYSDNRKYATIARTTTKPPHIEQFSPDDVQYLSRSHPDYILRSHDHHMTRPSSADHMTRLHTEHGLLRNVNEFHQPRSRAPICYDPMRYQVEENYIHSDRYQPHLHFAKMMTKASMHDQQYLKEKMKSPCLKESSV